jgi:hypothetical protein
MTREKGTYDWEGACTSGGQRTQRNREGLKKRWERNPDSRVPIRLKCGHCLQGDLIF